MSGKAAIIAFHSNKNCFINLPKDWTHRLSREKIAVFEVRGSQESLFASWAGGATVTTTADLDTVQINGLFAWKQNIQHGDEVLVSQVASVPVCSQIFVEPVTITDWEILEQHAAAIESGLLRQVRAVWLGQIIPIWVEKNICIFVKIGQMIPSAKCCLLEENSEVIVSPKSRSASVPNVPSGDSQRTTNGSLPNQPKETANKDTRSNHLSVNGKQRVRNLSGNKFVEDLKKAAESYNEKPAGNTGLPNGSVPNDDRKFGDSSCDAEDRESRLRGGQMGVVRKTLGYFRSWWSGIPQESLNGSEVNRLKGSEVVYEPEFLSTQFDCFLRVQSLDSITKCQSVSDESNSSEKGITESFFLHSVKSGTLLSQPSTVFISRQTFLQMATSSATPVDHVGPFLATVSKVLSPIERDEAQNKKLRRDQLLTQTLSAQSGGRNHAKQENDLEKLDTSDKDQRQQQTVRVVVTDCDSYVAMANRTGVTMNSCAFKQTCNRLTQLSLSHVAISDLFRNQMGCEKTANVRLTATKQDPVVPKLIKFSPLFSAPSGYSKDMLLTAAATWCETVSHTLWPLVINQGSVVQVPIKPDFAGYFLVTYQSSKLPVTPDYSYCLLSPAVISQVQLVLGEQLTVSQLPHGLARLVCSSVEDVDLPVPRVTLKQLGGVNQTAHKAMDLMDISLAQRPLASGLFSLSPGLSNGGILLCGSRGVGKSSLGQALGRYATEWPNLAYVTTVDCKALRGKRLESIRKTLDRHMEEASWRQPSVVLLDDLDHLTASPSGPEQEMSGEALYYARVAEVVKEMMDKELHDRSKLVVIATVRSRSSIHKSLVASRGKHYFQEVIQISPPDQAGREDILKAILLNKTVVNPKCISDLDLQSVSSQSEGYVANDLVMVVDRAIHAHMMVAPPGESNKNGGPDEVVLSRSDFDAAMHGFTPSALRNVSLHQAGALGWQDVGGLHDVRKTLVETLQWPSKYPRLFASCPLRLRSGLLLYGAPGTGKTLLAGVVAQECGLNFISIKGPELLSKYIGASEQAVRDTFIRAQSAKPCILFFDEFDSLAPRRGHDSTGVTDRVVNQLLTQLDGVEGLEGVYVLGATSRPDLIDPALLRPGRLDKALHCPLPDQNERLEILQSLTRNMTLDPDIDLTYFSQSCDHFTGADFKALLYNAQLEAIHEVTGQIRKETNQEQNIQSGPNNQEQNIQSGPINKEQNIHFDQQRVDAANLTQDVGIGCAQRTMEKPFSPEKRVLLIPSLEEGSVEISPDGAQEYMKQFHYPVLPSSERREKKNSATVIKQSHLVNALRGMGPSVSASERRKYQHIYKNFVSSRGGTFSGQVSPADKKATLA